MVTKNLNRLSKAIIWVVLFALLPSCSTKKNTFTRRVYHNLTAHYNTYWNGNEAFKEGIHELSRTLEDNYAFIIPVFNYGTEQNAQGINQYMDKAIEKASKTINMHSMKFKNKEYVRWINDSYLLIGKAYFYKQEYLSARRTFDFISKEYGDDPIHLEAKLWLTRTYDQMGEFEKASTLLDLIRSRAGKEEFPKSVTRLLPLVQANHYILQKKYTLSVPLFTEALNFHQPKELKGRIYFILGQINQQDKKLTRATEYYSKVLHSNPAYRLSFNARINMAQCYNSQSGDKDQMLKELTKMLKDIKNEDYKDQIYYAMAEIAQRDGNDSLSKNYLALSVANSISNDYQKSISSLKLAELYFEEPYYKGAQQYYDSAMQVIPEDYPGYKQIASKAEVLNSLIENLETVHEQDSLRKLALMPESERNNIIDKIIAKYLEEEERRKEEELLNRTTTQMGRNMGLGMKNQPAGGGKGGWYFYNAQALSFGFTEFNKLWGKRKLEDNWRLSNKRQVISFNDEDLLAQDSTLNDSTAKLMSNPRKREYYFTQLPLTPEKLAQSDTMISSALYHLGFIYKEGLKDNVKATDAFEDLIGRYPGGEYDLSVSYQMYKIAPLINNEGKSEYYKNYILTKYPDSDYAKLIRDPDYYKELAKERGLASELYSETYNAFKSNEYETVIMIADEAISTYTNPDLLSRFEYLKAVSKGKLFGKDSLEVSLAKIMLKYPDSEVYPLAEAIMMKLNPNMAGSPQEEIQFPYTYSPEEKHMYLMIIDDETVNINSTKVKISDFNNKGYSLLKLRINSLFLDKKRQIITCGEFKTAIDAQKYMNAVSMDTYVNTGLKKESIKHLIISAENYRVFYKEKDVELYEKFLNKFYHNNK